MAEPEKNGKDLKQVAIYQEDADEFDRTFGKNVSVAKRFRGMLQVIKRERKVEHVKRAILGGIEELERRITPERNTDPAPRDGPAAER